MAVERSSQQVSAQYFRIRPDMPYHNRKYLDDKRAVDIGRDGKPIGAIVFGLQEGVIARGLPDTVVDELKQSGVVVEEDVRYRLGRAARETFRKVIPTRT